MATQALETEILKLKVIDYWEPGKGWKWGSFVHLLPTSILLKLADTVLGQPENTQDKVGWLEKGINKFEVKTTYGLITRWRREDKWAGWKKIWSLRVHQRVRDCVWLLVHDKILTNVSRWRMGISITARCSRCNEPWEDSLHVFRDCHKARKVWYLFHPQAQISSFFSSSLKEWPEENLKCQSGDGEEFAWAENMSLICWALWRWRNSEIFNGEVMPLDHKFQSLPKIFDEAKMAVKHPLQLNDGWDESGGVIGVMY